MPKNPNRVLVLDTSELKKTTSLYLPYANVGLTPDKATDTRPGEAILSQVEREPDGVMARYLHHDTRTLRAQLPVLSKLLKECAQSLFVTHPHHIRSSFIIRLEDAIEKSQAKWAREIAAAEAAVSGIELKDRLRKIRVEQLKGLVDSLKQIIGNGDGEMYLQDSLKRLERQVKRPLELTTYFNALAVTIAKREREGMIQKTSMEMNVIRIDGEKIHSSRNGGEKALEKFENELLGKKLCPELVDFLKVYLNQQALILGPNNLWCELLNAIASSSVISGDFTKDKNSASTSHKTNLEVKSPTCVEATFDGQIFNLMRNSLPGGVDAKVFLRYQIEFDPTAKSPDNITVKIAEGYLDVYNEEARKLFYQNRLYDVRPILPRVRILPDADVLLTNDYNILESSVADFITPDRVVDTEKLQQCDAAQLFILMWQNQAYAETILAQKKFSMLAFFGRNYDDIEKDLTIISRKYFLSPKIQDETKLYLLWVNTFKTYPSNSPESKQVFLRAIAAELAKPGEQKNYLLNTMLSIKDQGLIADLLNTRAIRNHLNENVLTHFALQNKQFAEQILQPSLWERFTFSVRRWFGRTGSETLPKDKLQSASLKKIVATHPRMWSTAFARNSEARAKLEPKEVRELLDASSYNESHAYVSAYNAIFTDSELKNKAQRHRPFTALERMNFDRDNPERTLNVLAELPHFKGFEDARRTIPSTIAYHRDLDDQNLLNFYKAKFKQARDRKQPSSYFIQAIEDLWGKFPNAEGYAPKNNWVYHIPLERKAIVKAALLDVISDLHTKTPSVRSTNHWLPEEISLADMLVNNSVGHLFRNSVMPEENLRQLQLDILTKSKAIHELKPSYEFDSHDVRGIIMGLEEANNNTNNSYKNAFRGLFDENTKFLELIQNSVVIHQELLKVFTDPTMVRLAKDQQYLRLISEKIVNYQPKAANEAKTFPLILKLFEQANFITQLQQFAYLSTEYHFPLYQLLVSLNTKARFYKALVEDEKLILFQQQWDEYKAKEPQELVNLSLMIPSEKFLTWLKLNKPEMQSIIKLLNQNCVFRENFIATHNVKLIEELLEQAKNRDLINLLVKSKTILQIYITTIRKALLVNDQVYTPANGAYRRECFQELLRNCDAHELALLISQNEKFLETIVQVDLFAEFKDEIFNALKLVDLPATLTQLVSMKRINNNDINKALEESDVAAHDRERYFKDHLNELIAVNNPALTIKTVVQLLTSDDQQRFQVVSAILGNRELSQSILANADADSLTKMLGAIVAKLAVAPQLKTSLRNWCNHITMKLISDENFRNRIHNTTLSNLLSSHADIELLAKFLQLDSVELKDWTQGLSRIAEDKTLFEDNLSYLSMRPGFSGWLMQQAANTPDALFYADRENNALIKPALMQKALERDSFPEMITILNRQYSNRGMYEPSLRELLLKNDVIKRNFKLAAVDQADNMLEVICAEGYHFKGSDQLTEWLQRPFIGYLITKGSAEKIDKLVRILSNFKLTALHTDLLKELTTQALNIPDVRAKLFRSTELLAKVLESSSTCNNDDFEKLIVLLMSEVKQYPELTPLLRGYANQYVHTATKKLEDVRASLADPHLEADSRTARVRVLQETGNNLLQFYINLITHIHEVNLPLGSLQNELSILKILTNNAARLLSSDFDPQLQYRLIRILGQVIGNGEKLYQTYAGMSSLIDETDQFALLRAKLYPTETDFEDFARAFYANLLQMDALSRPALMHKFLNALTINQLVQLYLAVVAIGNYEKRNFPGAAHRVVSSFTEVLRQPHFMNRMFFYGDAGQLRDLFHADPQVVRQYMTDAKVVRASSSARPTQATLFGAALRARVINDGLPAGYNLLTRMVANLGPEHHELQFEFLNSDPRLLSAYLYEVESSPILILGDNFDHNVDGLVTYGNVDNVINLIKGLAFKDSKDKDYNTATNYLASVVLRPDHKIHNKFIGYLQQNEQLRQVFFDSMKLTMSSADIFKVLKEPRVENLFLNYFSSKDIETIFAADITTSQAKVTAHDSIENKKRLDQDKHNFIDYLFNSPRNLDLYLLLNHNVPGSILNQIIDERLSYEGQIFSAIFLHRRDGTRATPGELAMFYNLELKNYLNKFKLATPLTNVMFQLEGKFEQLMLALPMIDEDKIYSQLVQNAIAFHPDKPLRSMANAQALMNNYTLDEHGLRLADTPANQPVILDMAPQRAEFLKRHNLIDQVQKKVNLTYGHELAYLYAHHTVFLYQTPKVVPGVNIFDYYTRYIQSMENYVALDDQGTLRFRSTGHEVQADHRIFYLEALARYIYHPRQEHQVQTKLSKMPRLAEAYWQSVKFNEQGVAQWANEYDHARQTPEGKSDVPTNYVNTVLFAYANWADRPEMTLPIAQALLRSVQYHNKKYYFSGTRLLSNTKVIPGYLTLVYKAIDLLLKNQMFDFSRSSHVKLVLLEPQFLTMIKNNPDFTHAVLAGVVLLPDGKLHFKDKNSEVPAEFLPIIQELAKGVRTSNPEIFMLSRWANFVEPGVNISPLELLKKIELKQDGNVVFSDEPTIVVPERWLNHALSCFPEYLNEELANPRVDSYKVVFWLGCLESFLTEKLMAEQKILKERQFDLSKSAECVLSKFLYDQFSNPAGNKFIELLPRNFFTTMLKLNMSLDRDNPVRIKFNDCLASNTFETSLKFKGSSRAPSKIESINKPVEVIQPQSSSSTIDNSELEPNGVDGFYPGEYHRRSEVSLVTTAGDHIPRGPNIHDDGPKASAPPQHIPEGIPVGLKNG